MAAELGSYKQAHTSSPPLTLGNSRVVEGPAPLKELGSRAQAMRGEFWSRDWVVEAPSAICHDCYPNHIAPPPLMDLPARVVSLLEGGPTSPFRAEPGRVPWAKTRQPPGASPASPNPRPGSRTVRGAPALHLLQPTEQERRRQQRACAVHPGARRRSVLKWGGWQKNSGDGRLTPRDSRLPCRPASIGTPRLHTCHPRTLTARRGGGKMLIIAPNAPHGAGWLADVSTALAAPLPPPPPPLLPPPPPLRCERKRSCRLKARKCCTFTLKTIHDPFTETQGSVGGDGVQNKSGIRKRGQEVVTFHLSSRVPFFAPSVRDGAAEKDAAHSEATADQTNTERAGWVNPRSVSGVEMRKRQAAHIEAPPQAPGQPRPNTCCLCWCGCCKCLWNEDRMERSERQTCTKMDSIEAAEEQHPSLEEVLSWSRSFELMLRSLEGREVFREFLRSEYSEDNLLFWLACEELKKETNPTVVEEKSRIIYEDYVSILSPKEVPAIFVLKNITPVCVSIVSMLTCRLSVLLRAQIEVSLDSRVREGINLSLAEPSNLMYEEAQFQIYTLMHRDSFPRFLNSSRCLCYFRKEITFVQIDHSRREMIRR
ncbi:hypothetical protein L3Q82_001810 [Scortum barcoo]|uniref:Uncharacterized protein n=1 Tax=Scortum barcoo TaxID=214431 RepID=A0ACB8W508_9TELE|nr:hypothetical protein L3Q82_001810 [Scortum barcoo]